VRRLVVALSRARLGLYVAGRVALFEGVPELAPAFQALPRGPLRLRVGELWPTARRVEEEEGGAGPGVTTVRGVEHLMDLVEKVSALQIAATAQHPPAQIGQ
jgi:intron-binding protein aquarius